MHVVIFHPARLPVKGYGGTERVVVWLARALLERGHRVTLIAGRGSQVAQAELVAVDVKEANRHSFDLSPLLPATTDVVHYLVPVHRPPDIPYLWTMQGNAAPEFDPGDRCVFVSGNHARRHQRSLFVYNGIDPAEYVFSSSKEDYLLFLGRLHGVKGWREAVSIARRAGRQLRVAGGWRPTLRTGLRFEGVVGGARKADLLAKAAALLMPIQWEEPFGIVVAEALMSGTPVIGTPRGSLPELVPGSVGALSAEPIRLAEFARMAPGPWEPEVCRAYAERHLSHRAMAKSYESIYQHLLVHGELPHSI